MTRAISLLLLAGCCFLLYFEVAPNSVYLP